MGLRVNVYQLQVIKLKGLSNLISSIKQVFHTIHLYSFSFSIGYLSW